MGTLMERLNQLEQLPAHPGVLVELSMALSDPDSSSADIERIASGDTALALAVMRRSNSAAFCGDSPTSSLRDAVTRLGTRDLLRVAAAHRSHGPLDEAGKSYGLAPGEAWHAARAGAFAAAAIAERTDLADPAACFTGALLRDCGKLAMDQLLVGGAFEELLIDRSEQTDIVELERAALGVDYAEVGAALALRWGLSAELVAAIRHHHNPPSEGDDALPLVDIVHCADGLCAMLGLGIGLDGLAYSLDSRALERVGLGLEQLHAYYADLAAHLHEQDPPL